MEEIPFGDSIKLTLYYRGTTEFVSRFVLEAPNSRREPYIHHFQDGDWVTKEDAIRQARWGSGLEF